MCVHVFGREAERLKKLLKAAGSGEGMCVFLSQPHLAASDCRWSSALLFLALIGILNFFLISISTHSGCLQFCGVTEEGLALFWVM